MNNEAQSSQSPGAWVHDKRHSWSRPDGATIQRLWTLGGKRETFFLVYRQRADYHAGNNFGSFSDLRSAKAAF